jgi:transcription-repair coupling factor (superfamily II helicase)
VSLTADFPAVTRAHPVKAATVQRITLSLESSVARAAALQELQRGGSSWFVMPSEAVAALAVLGSIQPLGLGFL